MSRSKEDSLKWFPLDVTFFSNRKVKILKSRYGADGITLYLYILCEIYGGKGYFIELNEDLIYLMSDDLNMSDEKIRQILKFLYERSLLVQIQVDESSTLFTSDTIITAEGIQEQYQTSTKLLKRDVEIYQELWVLPEDKTLNHIKFVHDDINPRKKDINPRKKTINTGNNAQRKEKENKGNKSKEKEEPGAFLKDPSINVLFLEYLDVRKDLGCSNSDREVEILINKLSDLTKEQQKQTIEDSILNRWKGFFPKISKYPNKKSKEAMPEMTDSRAQAYKDMEVQFTEDLWPELENTEE
ncbi:DUF4373 domain-containing protein [Acetobacterium paludosum]|uniref:DUF4373 domain-containing protein n=1 Tax=Acetobacterium paludosum TaxID=52693 RepID=A0A923HVV4_9FIRM|nr:DUF4373 domain-containing protein [Acetobacterium paludosum]MBC3889478.1 DUF4373 domain-containing protein [Acetobacterium paludosum]